MQAHEIYLCTYKYSGRLEGGSETEDTPDTEDNVVFLPPASRGFRILALDGHCCVIPGRIIVVNDSKGSSSLIQRFVVNEKQVIYRYNYDEYIPGCCNQRGQFFGSPGFSKIVLDRAGRQDDICNAASRTVFSRNHRGIEKEINAFGAVELQFARNYVNQVVRIPSPELF